jgi:hypothetical protein
MRAARQIILPPANALGKASSKAASMDRELKSQSFALPQKTSHDAAFSIARMQLSWFCMDADDAKGPVWSLVVDAL